MESTQTYDNRSGLTAVIALCAGLAVAGCIGAYEVNQTRDTLHTEQAHSAALTTQVSKLTAEVKQRDETINAKNDAIDTAVNVLQAARK